MSKLPAILPTATAVLLLAFAGGCATKEDVAALRAEVASKGEVEALHADVAGLRASIEAGRGPRHRSPAPPPEYQELRSEIAALQASIDRQATTRGAGATATEAAVTTGPPPAGYQKVSTLAKLPDFIPGLGALYVRPQTLPAGPFLGYDRDDRLVNTV